MGSNLIGIKVIAVRDLNKYLLNNNSYFAKGEVGIVYHYEEKYPGSNLKWRIKSLDGKRSTWGAIHLDESKGSYHFIIDTPAARILYGFN